MDETECEHEWSEWGEWLFAPNEDLIYRQRLCFKARKTTGMLHKQRHEITREDYVKFKEMTHADTEC